MPRKSPNLAESSKKRLGARLVEGLSEFRDALASGQPLEDRFTIRTLELDLQPQEYDPESVRLTRDRLGVSQAVFAKLLAVSVDLVQSWEQGSRKPSKMACRLLDEINRDRQHWLAILKQAARGKGQETCR